MNRKQLISNLVRIVLSLLALALLVRQVGGKGILAVLSEAKVGLLVLAWALFLLGVVVRTFRWRALLYGLGLRPSFGLLLKLYLVGGFFNTFLPSGFGGDVVRVVELGQEAEESSAALGTVFVDRLTGILSLMAMGLVILPFASGLEPWIRWVFGSIAFGGLIAGALLLEGRLLLRMTGWLPGGFRLTGEGKLAKIYAAITGSGTRAIWMALVFSTLFNLTNILLHGVCATAVGMDLNPAVYFVVVPLLALTLLLPISMGGLGPRDWLAQVMLIPLGVTTSHIAAWTLSVWAVSGLAGLVGGLVYLVESIFDLTRKRGQLDRDY